MQQATQQQQQTPPSHLKVPLQTYGMMMNLLYQLPYAQVAELIGLLNQSEPVFSTETTLDSRPGVVVKSSTPSAPAQQTENGSNENGQRSEPEPT